MAPFIDRQLTRQKIRQKISVQYALDLRKIFGVAKKFLKSRSFLFQTLQNPLLPIRKLPSNVFKYFI